MTTTGYRSPYYYPPTVTVPLCLQDQYDADVADGLREECPDCGGYPHRLADHDCPVGPATERNHHTMTTTDPWETL